MTSQLTVSNISSTKSVYDSLWLITASFNMKVLKSRLYEFYTDERDREQEKKMMEKKDIAWGHQIRSYVFQPYTMVKDHRTKFEKGNVQAVMDGYIDEFIEEFLKSQILKP